MAPNSAMGSAAFSLLFTVPASLFVVGVRLFVNYGWGLFAAVPFAMGFAAVITHGINEPRSLAGCINVAVLSNVILGVALLAFAFEGVICLLMAAPFAIPLACFGEWIFRAGIAYPIRAEIDGNGQGAERRCVFSTGAFVEPIEVWDEPRRLKFAVTSNPAPMPGWTPYPHIEPPICMAF